MNKLTELYQTLLEKYTEQVEGIETRLIHLKSKHGSSVGGEGHAILNHRMFKPDDLQNNQFNGNCIKEKNIVLPHLLNFKSAYEKYSEEERKLFEKMKPKSKYQKYLDELYIDKNSYLIFFEAELSKYNAVEKTYNKPIPPKNNKAHKQFSIYIVDMKKHEEKIEKLNHYRNEIRQRIILFKELLNSPK